MEQQVEMKPPLMLMKLPNEVKSFQPPIRPWQEILLGANQADIDDVTAVEGIVTKDAGRMNQGDFTWKFNNETDDTSYGLNSELMSKIRNYKTQLISVGVK